MTNDNTKSNRGTDEEAEEEEEEARRRRRKRKRQGGKDGDCRVQRKNEY